MAKPDPTVLYPPDDTRAFVSAVEEGKASLDRGKSVPYEKVRRWLLSWGTAKELPPPK